MGSQKPQGSQQSSSDPEVLEAKKRESPQRDGKSAKGRSDLRREILSREIVGPDTETVGLISSLDKDKPLSEQPRSNQALELVSYPLIAKCFKSGLTSADLTISGMGNIQPDSIPGLNPTERAALLKIRDIANAPGCAAHQELAPKWQAWLTRTHDIYQTAPGVGEKPKSPPPPEKKDGVLGKASDAWGFVKKNKYKILAGIAVAAATIGIYKIFFGKKEDPEKKSLLDKIGIGSWGGSALKVGGGVLIAGLIAGTIFGPGRIKDFLKDLFKAPGERIDQFWTLLSEGHYREAFKALTEGPDENWDKYKDLAAKLKEKTGKEIRIATIKSIANVKLKRFLALGGQVVTAISALASEIPGIGMAIPNDEEQAEEEKIVRDYLEQNKTNPELVALSGEATVMDALGKLTGVEVGKPTEASEKDKDRIDVVAAVETGTDKLVAVAGTTLTELKEEFKDKKTIQEFLKKYEGKWTSAILSPIDFVNDLLTACHKDSVPVVVGAGKILLWNGYKFATFTSAEVLFDSAKELIEAPFSDDVGWSDGISTYIAGSVPFIIVAGVGSGIWAAIKGGKVLEAAAKGAGRGLIFPMEVARLHVAAGQRVYRTARGIEFFVRESRAADEALTAIIENRARFYAEISFKYDALLQSANEPGHYWNPKKWYGKLTSERATNLRTEYLRRFIRAHNDLQAALARRGLPTSPSIPDAFVKDAKSMEIMRDWRDAHPSPEVAAKAATPAPLVIPDETPSFVKTEGTGPDAKHYYKYNNQEIALTEKEIGAKAAEIEKGKPAGTTTATENWNEAIKVLVQEKFLTPTLVDGKPNTYLLQGKELVLDSAEIKARVAAGAVEADAIKEMCYEKVLTHMTVQEVRVVNGKYQYKMGGQWIENMEFDQPAKMAELKAKFVKVLAEKGASVDFQKFAAESKALTYFPVIEKAIGTAAAVLMIYHLETATDKRKAVAETAAGFGAFWAGMKLTDWKVSSRIIKNPNTPAKFAIRTVIDIMGGLAAAYKLTEPIGELVDSAFSQVPGSYGASKEMIDIFEKATTRSTVRIALASAEKGVLKKLVVKAGLKGLSEFMEKKIGGVFLKKIGMLAAKQGFKQVLKALGWKGVTTAVLLADDATLVGVVDDVVAAGLLVWMAFDIYDIVKLILNAQTVKTEMDKRNGVEIASFRVLDPTSRAALQEKLIPFGLTVDRAQELGEQQLFDILRTIPQTAVEIKRVGMSGKEVWTLNSGEAVGIAIFGDNGEKMAEIADEDATKMDEALTSMEKSDGSPPAEGAAANSDAETPTEGAGQADAA